MSKKSINKNKYGYSEYLALAAGIVAGLVMMGMFFLLSDPNKENDESQNGEYIVIDMSKTDQSIDENVISSQEVEDEFQSDSVYDTIIIPNIEVKKGDLILVSNQYMYSFVDETPVVDVYSYKNNKYKIGTGEERLFEKTIIAANSFLGDFKESTGLSNVTMINGFITEEEQSVKYENYIKSSSPEDAEKWGVKPGGSEHHTGLAFNLMLYPSGGEIGKGEYAWLTENAYKYGFILRYPEDKQDTTGVKDNNHFRYVGVPHAEYMYSNNMCLEEYILYLEETSYKSPLKISDENREYVIYYVSSDVYSESTSVKVPKGFSYTYSGNNINGFIITAYIDK